MTESPVATAEGHVPRPHHPGTSMKAGVHGNIYIRTRAESQKSRYLAAVYNWPDRDRGPTHVGTNEADSLPASPPVRCAWCALASDMGPRVSPINHFPCIKRETHARCSVSVVFYPNFLLFTPQTASKVHSIRVSKSQHSVKATYWANIRGKLRTTNTAATCTSYITNNFVALSFPHSSDSTNCHASSSR